MRWSTRARCSIQLQPIQDGAASRAISSARASRSRGLRLSGRAAGGPPEGTSPLAYAVFDKLQRVSHAAIVENRRLGEVLGWIKERQDAQPTPSGGGPRRSSQKSGLMQDRADRLAQVAPSEAGA